MDAVTPKWQSQRREINLQGAHLGQLVITPDPSFEYAEIWKQITDLFVLLTMFFVVVNLMVAWAVGRALEPTGKILRALESLEGGDLKARLPLFELPELARIGEKFNHMVETLEQSINRNHRLSQQLITLQEEERKNLARDLHDEFGQCLTAIHADSTVVLQVAENRCPEILDSARAINRLSRHLMDLVSGLLQRLRPGVLDELGLVSALQDLVETWQLRHEAIICKLELADAIPDSLDEALQVTIYRLVQECLTNVSRHAGATEVAISVTLEAAAGQSRGLRIRVRDNGRGFDPAMADGFGLPGMRERVEGLGGSLTLQTAIEQGTAISAWLPIRTLTQ
jgi:two-component system sensor histidine kinase UhpB